MLLSPSTTARPEDLVITGTYATDARYVIELRLCCLRHLQVMQALSTCPPRQSAAQLVTALRHSGLDARLVAPKARSGGEPYAVATLGAGRGDNAAIKVAGRSVGAEVWCNGQPYAVVLGQLAGCAHGGEQRLEQQEEIAGVLDDDSLVVEPALQEIFATPLATAAYTSAVSRLPQVGSVRFGAVRGSTAWTSCLSLPYVLCGNPVYCMPRR